MPSSLFNSLDISGSGMAAERYRMEVVANNIANAQTTRDKDNSGSAYRRKEVVLETVYNETMSGDGFSGRRPVIGGVRVVDTVPDPSELPRINNPSHPDAVNGYVTLPNVSLPNEMVDLITATRTYEANLKAIQSFKQMVEQSLQVLRS